jgi:hypothetical protein
MAAVNVMELAVARDLVARARLDRAKKRAAADLLRVRIPAPERAAFGVRYATEEERLEARRTTFRESARRLYSICPDCGGRKAAHSSVKRCRDCYLAAVEPAHGTVTRYVSRRFQCRCSECRAAASAYHRTRRQQMTAWKEAV